MNNNDVEKGKVYDFKKSLKVEQATNELHIKGLVYALDNIFKIKGYKHQIIDFDQNIINEYLQKLGGDIIIKYWSKDKGELYKLVDFKTKEKDFRNGREIYGQYDIDWHCEVCFELYNYQTRKGERVRDKLKAGWTIDTDKATDYIQVLFANGDIALFEFKPVRELVTTNRLKFARKYGIKHTKSTAENGQEWTSEFLSLPLFEIEQVTRVFIIKKSEYMGE